MLRKERIHRCGYTNIDFRSKKDKDSIKLFQPWKLGKDFGTMGNSDYRLTSDELKVMMEATKKITRQKNVNSQIPDPRYHKTGQYYLTNGISIKQAKTFFNDERIANLDETFKGKERFTGDSLMIAENTKLKKHKDKSLSETDKIKKCNL